MKVLLNAPKDLKCPYFFMVFVGKQADFDGLMTSASVKNILVFKEKARY